ncbi:MAG: LacI family DNA-binding transcriptional regulator [Beutenbergiaceae bacterium]
MATDRPDRRVTLADIAARTGYSRAHVSLVLRGAPGASEESRARVLAAARDLGYRPDARARALAGQRSWSMGVMFGQASTFHLDLIDGVYSAVESRGYSVVLSAMTPRRDEAQALATLNDFRTDGLFMLGPATANPVLAGRRPVAVIGWHVDDPTVDSVYTSDAQGIDTAIAHLSDLGHRRIAHIDGGDGLIAQSRRACYMASMRSRGLADGIEVYSGGETQLAGQRAALELIHGPQRPTAVLCYNDDVAVAAIPILEHHGLSVPGDVSVVGWDDTALAQVSPVPLTTVRQEPAMLAEAAFSRLIARIDGMVEENGTADVVLEARLMVRGSTARPPELLT